MHPDVTNVVAVISGTGSNAVSFREVEGRIEAGVGYLEMKAEDSMLVEKPSAKS